MRTVNIYCDAGINRSFPVFDFVFTYYKLKSECVYFKNGFLLFIVTW